VAGRDLGADARTALGYHRVAEAHHVDAFFQHPCGERRGHLGIVEHHGNDGMAALQHIKAQLAELEARRKEAIAENDDVADKEVRGWFNRDVNRAYDRRRQELISSVYDFWHNDQMYHLIYKDGSEVVITAEEILSGEPFPKMSDIVYAEMSSADDHMDTETGDLYWYSDERMEACDWDYDVEGERVWQYETAIQYKFGTEWAKRYSRQPPEFIPMAI